MSAAFETESRVDARAGFAWASTWSSWSRVALTCSSAGEMPATTELTPAAACEKSSSAPSTAGIVVSERSPCTSDRAEALVWMELFTAEERLLTLAAPLLTSFESAFSASSLACICSLMPMRYWISVSRLFVTSVWAVRESPESPLMLTMVSRLYSSFALMSCVWVSAASSWAMASSSLPWAQPTSPASLPTS